MDNGFQIVEPGNIALHLPAQYRYLAIVRDAALEACRRVGLNEFDCYKVEMAIDEACTNVIEHSYGGEPPPAQALDHPGFTVEFFEQPEQLIVDVKDQGGGFDFDGHDGDHPDSVIAGESDRGLGVYIIRQFVDGVEYQRDPRQGNRLRLTKNR